MAIVTKNGESYNVNPKSSKTGTPYNNKRTNYGEININKKPEKSGGGVYESSKNNPRNIGKGFEKGVKKAIDAGKRGVKMDKCGGKSKKCANGGIVTGDAFDKHVNWG